MVFINILPRFTIKGDKALGVVNHNHSRLVVIFVLKPMGEECPLFARRRVGVDYQVFHHIFAMLIRLVYINSPS